jgi:hypothetical protein
MTVETTWRCKMSFMAVFSAIIFSAVLAISASCGITVDDPRDDPGADVTEQGVTTEGSQLDVPEDLQLAPALPKCKNLKGSSCVLPRLCNEVNHRVPVPATGCSSTKVCCIPE